MTLSVSFQLTIKGEKYESEDSSESRQINFLPFGTAVGSPKITPYTVMFYATTVVALLLASTFGSTAMIGLTAYGALIASQDLIDMQLVLSGPVLSASSGDNIDGKYHTIKVKNNKTENQFSPRPRVKHFLF